MIKESEFRRGGCRCKKEEKKKNVAENSTHKRKDRRRLYMRKKSEKRLRRSLNQSALEDLTFEALYHSGARLGSFNLRTLAMLTNGARSSETESERHHRAHSLSRS